MRLPAPKSMPFCFSAVVVTLSVGALCFVLVGRTRIAFAVTHRLFDFVPAPIGRDAKIYLRAGGLDTPDEQPIPLDGSAGYRGAGALLKTSAPKSSWAQAS
jgi:hypothetical protein